MPAPRSWAAQEACQSSLLVRRLEETDRVGYKRGRCHSAVLLRKGTRANSNARFPAAEMYEGAVESVMAVGIVRSRFQMVGLQSVRCVRYRLCGGRVGR